MTEFKTGTSCINWEALTLLYRDVGLMAGKGKTLPMTDIRKAFESSSKVVTAWQEEKLVGASRMLSDGICYAGILDVGVLSGFRGKGIGKGMIENLMKGNEHLCVYLTSTFGNEPFHEKLGFRRHKTAMAKYPRESAYLEEKRIIQ